MSMKTKNVVTLIKAATITSGAVMFESVTRAAVRLEAAGGDGVVCKDAMRNLQESCTFIFTAIKQQSGLDPMFLMNSADSGTLTVAQFETLIDNATWIVDDTYDKAHG